MSSAFGFTVEAEAKQWSVGQGGFFNQNVIIRKHGAEIYTLRFAYDCGTKSAQAILTKAVESYVNELPDNAVIDAVFVSHFDEDHVSGLKGLGEKLGERGITVRKVVVPPLTDLEPLYLVASRGGSPAWTDFVMNIGDRLRSWFSRGLDVIMASVPNLPDQEGEQSPTAGEGAVVWEDEESQVVLFETANGSLQVVAGAKHRPVNDTGVVLWEVLPFVQPSVIDNAEGLYRLIADKTKIDLDIHSAMDVLAISKEDRKALRGEIKNWTLGSINFASIILFSGPTRTGNEHQVRSKLPRQSPANFQKSEEQVSISTTRNGWLGTGDATLSDQLIGEECLAEMLAFYGERLGRLLVVNAPHHGSSHSSDTGFWRLTTPWFAVFNASGRHFGHPHHKVVKTASENSMLRVNTVAGHTPFTFTITG